MIDARELVDALGELFALSIVLSLVLGFVGYWGAQAFHAIVKWLRIRRALVPFEQRVDHLLAMTERLHARLVRLRGRRARRHL